MNPSNHFIYSHRRLLRNDSPSDSKAHREYNYFMVSVCLATFIVCDFIVFLLFLMCKCYIQSHPSPDPHHSNSDHPTTPKAPSNHDVLDSIPVYIYGIQSCPATSPSCSSEVETCVICLDEYVNGDCIRVLPRCKHMFHKDCIDQWLSVKSLHCPICRDYTIEKHVELARTNDPSSSMAFSLPTTN